MVETYNSGAAGCGDLLLPSNTEHDGGIAGGGNLQRLSSNTEDGGAGGGRSFNTERDSRAAGGGGAYAYLPTLTVKVKLLVVGTYNVYLPTPSTMLEVVGPTNTEDGGGAAGGGDLQHLPCNTKDDDGAAGCGDLQCLQKIATFLHGGEEIRQKRMCTWNVLEQPHCDSSILNGNDIL